MIIFCDGVFDLFHEGHINHFKSIKTYFKNCKLIVGVMKDKDVIEYKREPHHSESLRCELVKSCKYVDEIITEYPIVLTKDFLRKMNINYVVHAFSNNDDFIKQLKFFHEPIRHNQFYVIDYYKGISTTNLLNKLNNWKEIWIKKGNENQESDLRKLSGYENTEFDRDYAINSMLSNLSIKNIDKVLEIGCGSGYIAKELSKHCNYYGVDYSQSIVTKHYNLNPNNKILCCEANNLPFKDNYFDKIVCNGVFEYFVDKDYARQVINEMNRVSKSGIYILNIRHTTRTQKDVKHKYDGIFTHTIYLPDDELFKDFKIVDATFDKENRFSIIKL